MSRETATSSSTISQFRSENFVEGRIAGVFDGLQPESTLLGECLCARDIPRGHIREPGVADPARAHEVIECFDNLLHRSDHVPRVEPVDVDVIGAPSISSLCPFV